MVDFQILFIFQILLQYISKGLKGIPLRYTIGMTATTHSTQLKEVFKCPCRPTWDGTKHKSAKYRHLTSLCHKKWELSQNDQANQIKALMSVITTLQEENNKLKEQLMLCGPCETPGEVTIDDIEGININDMLEQAAPKSYNFFCKYGHCAKKMLVDILLTGPRCIAYFKGTLYVHMDGEWVSDNAMHHINQACHNVGLMKSWYDSIRDFGDMQLINAMQCLGGTKNIDIFNQGVSKEDFAI